MASLQSRLDEFKKAFESGAPPYNAEHEAIEKMHRATAELKASGIEHQALKIGDHVPSFTLFNQDHVQVVSSDLLRQGPLVTIFFRDTADLERYTRALHKKLNLTFDMLTDLHLKTAE